MSDDQIVTIRFPEGGELRIFKDFAITTVFVGTNEKIKHLEGQLEIIIAARDLAEQKLARQTPNHKFLGEKVGELDRENTALRAELAKRDRAYEEQAEKLAEELAMSRETVARQRISIQSQMLILQRLRTALKEADQEVSRAPLS